MSNDRIPVALKYAPKTFRFWPEESVGAAILAAFQEFPESDVYRETWGLRVLVSVPSAGALDLVVEGNARLHVACEYAVCELDHGIIDTAPIAT